MARTRVGDILGPMREGLADVGEKGQELARDVAERVEDVLDEAGVQGKRIRKELAHRWKTVDRVGRENDLEVFLYPEGLVVYFSKDGWQAQLMVFTLPQPLSAEPAPPKR